MTGRHGATVVVACLLTVLAACSSAAGPGVVTAGSAASSGAAAAGPGGASTVAGSGAATTSTPAPDAAAVGTGDLGQEVPDRTLVTNAPVPLDGTGDFGGGLTAHLSAVRPVTAEARLPGEVGGDAVSVTVDLDNASAGAVDLTRVTVDLQDAAGTPATLLESQSSPLSGSLGPGQAASGTYVFSYPSTRAGAGTIAVTSSTEEPIVLFAGTVR